MLSASVFLGRYGAIKIVLLLSLLLLTRMYGTRIENGGLQNTWSGYTVGTEGLQEKAGTAK